MLALMVQVKDTLIDSNSVTSAHIDHHKLKFAKIDDAEFDYHLEGLCCPHMFHCQEH
jgi:hypothetical protein